MTDRSEKRQQEIRQGTASHLRFNNNIYIVSLKWGHQQAWQDGKSNQIEWVSRRETHREREKENEARKDCRAILPLCMSVCKCVIRCLFFLCCAVMCMFTFVCMCKKSVYLFEFAIMFRLLLLVKLFFSIFMCAPLCLWLFSSLSMYVGGHVCVKSLVDWGERRKADGGAGLTKHKWCKKNRDSIRESLRGMGAREQELDQVNRERDRKRDRQADK